MYQQAITIDDLRLGKGYHRFLKGNYCTKSHRHYAIEVAIAKHGQFSIEFPEGIVSGLKAAIIPSNRSHAFRCLDADCEIWFIDPLSFLGQRLSRQYITTGKQLMLLNSRSVSAFYQTIDDYENSTSSSLLSPSISIDDRIVNCIDKIDKELDFNALRISQLQESACLSESRLSHLFVKELGISIRQYVLWRRIFRAADQALQGSSLTRAAHTAGFVDSSHFSRVFSQMFGVNPRFALKVSS